jgi:hypothetical protein
VLLLQHQVQQVCHYGVVTLLGLLQHQVQQVWRYGAVTLLGLLQHQVQQVCRYGAHTVMYGACCSIRHSQLWQLLRMNLCFRHSLNAAVAKASCGSVLPGSMLIVYRPAPTCAYSR